MEEKNRYLGILRNQAGQRQHNHQHKKLKASHKRQE